VVQASVIRQKPFMIVNPTSKPSICLKHIVTKEDTGIVNDDGGVANFLKKFMKKR